MGCCTYYLDLLRAFGVCSQTFLQDRLEVEVVRDGKRGVLSSAPLLGALHLLPSLIRYPHLGPGDKLLALYALARAKLTDRSRQAGELDGETFYDWLKRHRQTDAAIENLWNLVVLPTLNDDVRHVSADMALMVIQVGLLGGPSDAAIGYSRVGLTSLVDAPARRWLEGRSGVVVSGASVRALRIENGRASHVELASGRLLHGAAYVSALPPEELLRILPQEVAGGPFFSAITHHTYSPIVGVHLWYDRPVMEQDFVAFLDSPIQWVFNRSKIEGSSNSNGQHVCISISEASEIVDRPNQELRSMFVREMEKLFPRAREACIRRFRVIKERRATFRCVPGIAGRRPPPLTPIPNLFLAGEWTDTGWPSTMEGAVRSGVLAADALASRL